MSRASAEVRIRCVVVPCRVLVQVVNGKRDDAVLSDATRRAPESASWRATSTSVSSGSTGVTVTPSRQVANSTRTNSTRFAASCGGRPLAIIKKYITRRERRALGRRGGRHPGGVHAGRGRHPGRTRARGSSAPAPGHRIVWPDLARPGRPKPPGPVRQALRAAPLGCHGLVPRSLGRHRELPTPVPRIPRIACAQPCRQAVSLTAGSSRAGSSGAGSSMVWELVRLSAPPAAISPTTTARSA